VKFGNWTPRQAALALALAGVCLCAWNAGARAGHTAQAAGNPLCNRPGWYPADFGVKDHTVLWYDGYYYLIATYVDPDDPSPLRADHFAYARSRDLCAWEELPPVLAQGAPGAWDEAALWAPHAYYEAGVYYLYYTGVTPTWTQSILLATSTDPSDPASWQKQGLVFQPDHPDMVWSENNPSDCRDPHLLRVGEQYFLYYTGLDDEGGIIGAAVASRPQGPWTDTGRVVKPAPGKWLESPLVVAYGEHYYLFYNETEVGEFYQVGYSPTGAWLAARPFNPGWAHEIWQSTEGVWYTSYLTDYSVTINRLSWDASVPPQPVIEWAWAKLYLPLIEDE
jgi:predicted GH43/DUF377 family glycosyl hydrolase